MINIILLLLGLVVLSYGADLLVRGGTNIGLVLKISPLVIGLTIISFGTSAPEFIVNLLAAKTGNAELAISNIVGSNIANILLVLGVSAILAPLVVKSSTVWREIPFAMLGAILLLIMANDVIIDGLDFNAITRTDGLALISLTIIFMVYIYNIAKKDKSQIKIISSEDGSNANSSIILGIVNSLMGIILLFIGGNLIVQNASNLASAMGWSQALIGATIIAVGTSLPELATSVVAAKRNQLDMAVGNIVGSNIFNIFGVIGITAVISPLAFDTKLNFDILVAIFSAVLLFVLLLFSKPHTITKKSGILFVSLYVLYIIYVINRG